jgi:hypothetical protein
MNPNNSDIDFDYDSEETSCNKSPKELPTKLYYESTIKSDTQTELEVNTH